MQILPFVFSLILVFVFLISHSSYDERVDRALLEAFRKKAQARLELCKKGERSSFIRLRKINRGQNIEKETSIPKQYEPRPKKSLSSTNKFSLSFFEKNQGELAKEFAKKQLLKVCQNIYGLQFSQDFFCALLTGFLEQKPKQLCQLDFLDEKNKRLFFQLLTDPDIPLDQLLCVDEFHNKSLFCFGSLNRYAFEALFEKETLQDFFNEEKKLKIKFRTKSLPKEQLLEFFKMQNAGWELAYIDSLVCFQIPKQKTLKAISDLKSEFFYLVTD